MTRAVSISLDQFYRPQPGGIATYVRGLVSGLNRCTTIRFDCVGVAPRGVPTTGPVRSGARTSERDGTCAAAHESSLGALAPRRAVA